MNIDITNTHLWIMEYMKERKGEWVSPTEIGKAYRSYKRANGYKVSTHLHSSWASPRCKALVKKGLLERNEKGHYRIK